MQQIPLYDQMVAERLHAVVGDGRTMVLRGRCTFFVVFSRLFRDPVGDLSLTHLRQVADQLQT